jgi:hypothetical protein
LISRTRSRVLISASMASAAITTASQYQNQTVKQRLLPKAAVFLWAIIG